MHISKISKGEIERLVAAYFAVADQYFAEHNPPEPQNPKVQDILKREQNLRRSGIN